MKLALALLATVSWMGCGMDTGATGPGGGDDGTGGSDPGDPGDGTGPVTEVSGHITASTTWMNTIHVVGSVTIDRGVTLTVLPGTTVDVASGVGITVAGVLDVQGTQASKVAFRSATAGAYWSAIGVPAGGAMTAHYLIQFGGGLEISGTGKVTLVDTQMSHVGGDLLVMSGGTIDMSYSGIGLPPGLRDTTHCDMHVSGPVTLKVTHSNISGSSYGLMFYGGINADFTYDNWFGNFTDVDIAAGPPVSGDFSYSYFARGTPTDVGITAMHMATAMVGDAGVR